MFPIENIELKNHLKIIFQWYWQETNSSYNWNIAWFLKIEIIFKILKAKFSENHKTDLFGIFHNAQFKNSCKIENDPMLLQFGRRI